MNGDSGVWCLVHFERLHASDVNLGVGSIVNRGAVRRLRKSISGFMTIRIAQLEKNLLKDTGFWTRSQEVEGPRRV